MRFLSIGSRLTLRASFPRSVILTQLRFTLLTVTSSQRDLHPQVCAHAGRTNEKGKLRTASLQVFGAGNEARTRDLNLGKVALYQLSYSRMVSSVLEARPGVEPG
jgi:hypothetical protein